MKNAKPRTIVLIPGLWMTALSKGHWIERYVARGQHVIARSWPGMDDHAEAWRRDPTGAAQLGVTEVIEHYEAIIRELAEPPIIIGHSFGGAITQIIVGRGLGAAGVAIDSASLNDIPPSPRVPLKPTLPVLKNPTNCRRSVPMTPEEYRDAYAVPGPGLALFQAALANLNPKAVTRGDVRNERRAPLLLIAGEVAHVTPPSHKEFPGRTHFILGQAGWEKVADFALNWALNPTAQPNSGSPLEVSDPWGSGGGAEIRVGVR